MGYFDSVNIVLHDWKPGAFGPRHNRPGEPVGQHFRCSGCGAHLWVADARETVVDEMTPDGDGSPFVCRR